MPTRSEPAQDRDLGARKHEWTARSGVPRQSVFGNYEIGAAPAPAREVSPADGPCLPGACQAGGFVSLQASIDAAVARSFLHRLLAHAYEDPTPGHWQWLTRAATLTGLRAALDVLGEPSLTQAGERFAESLGGGSLPCFLDAYLACFGHAARGSCPLNEIEYGDINADPLFQPHRLADLAAFYRAFGLEVAADAGERQDHLCLELEFMCVLAAKEAYALEQQADAGELGSCRDAQKHFLREHLGRWTPAFARRLAAATHDPVLHALAELTRAFVEVECVRFGVKSGNHDLSLRPVDEAAERMCDSCGAGEAPTGGSKAS